MNSAPKKSENHRNLVCFGDSITECAGQAENHRWTARLAFLLEAKFPGRFHVFNRGVGGNTTALALDRIQADVIPLLPAVVLIEFGINDAYVYPWCKTPRVGLDDFRRNLQEIIRQVKSRGGQPCLIINHPLTRRRDLHPQGNRRSVGANLLEYNATIRDVAIAHGVGALDVPRMLKKEGIPTASLLSGDGVHLSNQGNLIFAQLVFEALESGLIPLMA